LVHGGFFIINCPYITLAGFDPSGLSYVNYLLENSRFTIGDASWGYFEFPITPILGAEIVKITGLSVFTMSKAVLLLANILIPLSAYIFYYRNTQKCFGSFLGVVIASIGAIILWALLQYRPGTIGFLFIILFLVLFSINQNRIGGNRAQVIMLVIFMVTLVLSHYITQVVFMFILLGIYLYQKWVRKDIISTNIIIFMLVIALSWWFYQSLFTTTWIVKQFTEFFEDTSVLSIWAILRKGQLVFGEEVPMWASIIRIFWVILLYVVPCLLALKIFFARNKKIAKEEIELGILVGIILLVIIMTLADNGANRSSSQFLLFSAFITPLILLRMIDKNYLSYSISKTKYVIKPAIMAALAIVIVLISAPTFYAHNPSVNTMMVYDVEHALYLFVREHVDYKNELQIYTDADTAMLTSYYLSEKTSHILPDPVDQANTKEEFTSKLNDFINSFHEEQRISYFLYSEKISHRSYIFFNISKQDVLWANIRYELNKYSIIYTNSFESAYING
jgi:uncharacterized membrane protein